jgi:hypothetical protein
MQVLPLKVVFFQRKGFFIPFLNSSSVNQTIYHIFRNREQNNSVYDGSLHRINSVLVYNEKKCLRYFHQTLVKKRL